MRLRATLKTTAAVAASLPAENPMGLSNHPAVIQVRPAD